MQNKTHKKHLPDSIGIFGRSVPIIETANITEGRCAEYCYETKRIFVDICLPYKSKKSALIHEALHALLHRVSINQTNLNSEVEEIIVESISNWLIECECFELRMKRRKQC